MAKKRTSKPIKESADETLRNQLSQSKADLAGTADKIRNRLPISSDDVRLLWLACAADHKRTHLSYDDLTTATVNAVTGHSRWLADMVRGAAFRVGLKDTGPLFKEARDGASFAWGDFAALAGAGNATSTDEKLYEKGRRILQQEPEIKNRQFCRKLGVGDTRGGDIYRTLTGKKKQHRNTN